MVAVLFAARVAVQRRSRKIDSSRAMNKLEFLKKERQTTAFDENKENSLISKATEKRYIYTTKKVELNEADRRFFPKTKS